MSRSFGRLARAALAVFFGLLVISQPVAAMRVSPMVLEMEATGGGSVARVEVQNINQGRLAFETRVYRMEIDTNGQITETPADDDFLIFPPQGVLAPGGRQVVRLQWVGEPEIPTSQSYYVSVEQLPVAFDEGSEDEVAAQVQVLYNLRALVVVSPPDARPEVTAKSARASAYEVPPSPGSDAAALTVQGVQVVLKNTGRRHAMMSNFGWKLEGKDEDGNFLRVDVSPEELSQAVGTGFVPALGERTFNLPITGFGESPIELTFKR
ncbi:MAG: fimbria/pilus periplasmic chaperone [Pseudomonadota bacterium]